MRLLSLVFAGQTASSAMAQLESRQDTPNAQIEILSISPTGPGCPFNSFSYTINDYDDSVPNRSGAVLGFDEPFFVPLASDEAAIADELWVTRSCTVKVWLRYPVGCSTATLAVTSDGYYQAHGDGRAAYERRFQISTGSGTDAGRGVFEPGHDDWSKTSIFKFQDTVLDQANIASGMQEQTLTMELWVDVWAQSREGIDDTFLKLDDVVFAFSLDSYDSFCSS